jgi:aminomethyltransferase
MVLTRMSIRPLERYFDARSIAMTELMPGRRVPVRFSDPDAEHLATRRAAGLFDLSFMACLEMKGAGSAALLNAIQTRNLTPLPVGRIRYALLLRDDGTVLNDATVWRTDEQTWLLFIGRREDLRHVTERAAGFDVRLDDRSDRFAVIALQGPLSRSILQRCLAVRDDLAYYGFAESDFRGCRCLVARLGYSGEAGYEIVIAADDGPALWEALRSAGAGNGLEECGFKAVDTLRIEAGHVLFSNELALQVTPYELGLARLLDHYRQPSTGMSALAARRFHEPRLHLVGLLLDGPLSPAASDDCDPGAAIVTSACRSPLLERWIGLGFVPGAHRYLGTRVQVGAKTRATVARLPFYDPGKQRPRT